MRAFEKIERGRKIIYKQPEFILIDDQTGEKRYTYFGPDLTKKLLTEEKDEGPSFKKGMNSLRFLCFLGLLFCLIFGFGIFLW